MGRVTLTSTKCRRASSSTRVKYLHTMAESITRYGRHCPRTSSLTNVPQAPLFLPLFAAIPSSLVPFLYILMDLLCAEGLMQIALRQHSGNERLFRSPRREARSDELLAGAAYVFLEPSNVLFSRSNRYLLNPLTIAACLGRSTSVFTNCAIIYAVLKAIDGRPKSSMVALVFASYLSMYPVLLAPPLALLSFDQLHRTQKTPPRALDFILSRLVEFGGTAQILLLLSYLVTDMSWEFLASTYGNHLLVTDLTPNIGLWWYFLIEMFDSFREFFLGVFWLHLGAYIGGFSLRMRRQPLFVVVAMLGIFAIFKPYPSISDAALFLSFLPLYRHVFPCRHSPRVQCKNAADLSSDAVLLLRRIRAVLRHPARARIPLPVDLCGLRQRQLLLRHHAGLEPGPLGHHGRRRLGCVARRMGGRAA